MSKIETANKVSVKLVSRINLEGEARVDAELSILDIVWKSSDGLERVNKW